MSSSVILIQLPSKAWCRDELNHTRSLPPLGLLYIGTVLQEQGHSVRLLDMMVNPLHRDEFQAVIQDANADVVGINSFIESVPFALEVIALVKETLPNAKLVLGGPAPSVLAENFLNRSAADYVVCYEGEETVTDLLSRLQRPGGVKPAEVDGLAYRDGDHIRINNRRPLINCLDELPFPDRNLIAVDRYAQPFSLLTSRGCPMDCIFCSSRSFWTRRFRTRSAENILAEVLWMIDKYQARDFHIVDDTFTASHRRVYDFCRLLVSSGTDLFWKCESRVDTVNEPLLHAMYEAGCRELVFGIESGQREILKAIHKGITPEQVEQTVALARKLGFKILTLFMLGHAQDTLQTMRGTLAFMSHLANTYGCHNRVSVNTPFPGTYQYEHAEELGIAIHSSHWEDFTLTNPNISTPNFSLEELRDLYNEARKLCYDLETADVRRQT